MPHTPKARSGKKSANGFLEILIYLASLFGPIFTIPQIYIIFLSKNAHSISVATWFGYLLVALIWTWYGVVKKDKPIIISNGLWAIAEVFVIVGAIIYR